MAESWFEEALLLYAIGYECQHKGIATLAGILSAEDAINRSAPTFEELNTGLNTLLSVNLVTEEENGVVVTPEGKKLYDTANEQEDSVFGRLAYLEKTLDAQFSDLQVNQLFNLDSEHFQQAYESYYGAT